MNDGPYAKPFEKIAAIALVIMSGLILLAAASLFGSTDKSKPHPSNEPESPKPSYSANIARGEVINPATWKFTALVKNTSKVSGTPSCLVRAQDESYTYKGFDRFDLKPIKPGKVLNWNGTLTITKEGAYYVTQASIECS